MKSLGTIVLPDGIRWRNRFSWSPVRQTTKRTTGGGIVHSFQNLIGGRPITLEVDQNSAQLWTFDDVSKILALARNPGNTHILTWDNLSYGVYFDHTQNPVHEFNPLCDYDEIEYDLFYGKIHLITI